MYKEILYTCMECNYEWESTKEDETYCPKCHTGDINKEEEQDDKG